MSSFVYGLAVIDCFFAVFLQRDAWFDLLVGQQGSDFVAVIAAITNQGFCLGQVLEQDIRTLEVAALSFGQVKPDGPPEVITQGMQLCVQPPPWSAQSVLARRPLFEARGGAMGLQVSGINHQNVSGVALWLGQFIKNLFEHTILRPSPEAVVERFVRTVFSGGVGPLQSVLNDVDDAAQNLAIIGAVNAAHLWKERSDPLNLFFCKPK